MYIIITQDGTDGNFTVGEQYKVASQHGMFVYAIDDLGNWSAVYNYQYRVAD